MYMPSEEGCRICVLKELSCFMSFKSLLIKIKYSVFKFKDSCYSNLAYSTKGGYKFYFRILVDGFFDSVISFKGFR